MAGASWNAELEAQVRAEALTAGFALTGVAAAEAVSDAETARFEAWVEAGRAGEMEYLKRRDASGVLLRSAVRIAIPWARSVVVCAFNYNAGGVRSLDPAPAGSGWVGRYAWSGRRTDDGSLCPTDYHDELLERLCLVEQRLQAAATCETRCYVDTGPILERSLAARAGVGWIGKNTCVIDQKQGSWLLLGVIVTSLEVPGEASSTAAPSLAPDRCGSCTRCIDACPTGALLATKDRHSAREMDASLCIAYLTIEKKGTIAEELRQPIGRHVFGCDICQEVCPWNQRGNQVGSLPAPVGRHEGMEPRAELVNPALEWLAGMDPAEFKRRFKRSPMERTGRRRLLRNVAIAMGNSGEERFLPQLAGWAAAAAAEDAVLAETARWAMERIEERITKRIAELRRT